MPKINKTHSAIYYVNMLLSCQKSVKFTLFLQLICRNEKCFGTEFFKCAYYFLFNWLHTYIIIPQSWLNSNYRRKYQERKLMFNFYKIFICTKDGAAFLDPYNSWSVVVSNFYICYFELILHGKKLNLNENSAFGVK